jgi:DNA repair protein RadC
MVAEAVVSRREFPGGDPGSADWLAAVLEPALPGRVREAAEVVLACGMAAWTSPGGIARARALGLRAGQARRLVACARLVSALERDGWAKPAPITGPADVLVHVADIRGARQERVVALYLDARNRPIHHEVVAVGGLRASLLHPRDVLRPALELPAAGIILAHNHPSGDTRPSQEDLEVTRQLAAAARLFGVELLDHLVVSEASYTSIKEVGGL